VRFAVESVGNHRAGPLLALNSETDYLVGNSVKPFVDRATETR
jgi:hypothetical protein